MITLTTKDYRLTPIEIHDADALFPIFNDKDTMAFITPHPVETIEEMTEKIENIKAKVKEEKELAWTIKTKEKNLVIGVFRFHKWHKWHQKAEMNAIISHHYQKTGVMSQLLPVVLEYGFCNLNLNRIVGDIFATNEGSKRLLLKHDFHCDGVLRQTDFDGERFHDTVVYSLLKDEYRAVRERWT
ncbi:GNAT family N-acetyltransferase [Alteribacter aurantiacus]|uniref:GNAT family N-acetyltransferase n=1 Tax=Alteribacter aurantiacus TaxID=254410 RepID=UPI00041B33FC|nr:GNAT family N-acetyltransferase [Alteribacter aurantiacus]